MQPKYVIFHPNLTIFLVKSKLSTAKISKTTTSSRVFHLKKMDNFSREIKVEYLNKKWRFRSVCFGDCQIEINNQMIFFFRRNYCMTRDAFKILCDELSDAIPHGNSTNGFSLLREERLLIFLWWAKGSAFVEQEAFAMDVSPTVVHNSIVICTKVCFKLKICIFCVLITF